MNRDMTNPTYRSWRMMKTRCKPDYERAEDYFERGITHDPSWESYDNFLKDMGERPNLELSLDRIDNNKGYCKENCRWATKVEQQRNQRDIRRNNITGVRGVCYEWSTDRYRAEGIYNGVRTRLYSGPSEWLACLARWEWEFVTLFHLKTGEWP